MLDGRKFQVMIKATTWEEGHDPTEDGYELVIRVKPYGDKLDEALFETKPYHDDKLIMLLSGAVVGHGYVLEAKGPMPLPSDLVDPLNFASDMMERLSNRNSIVRN